MLAPCTGGAPSGRGDNGARAALTPARAIANRLAEAVDLARAIDLDVREAGIVAPLMIMRGDGGVMSIDEMRRRPVMTMLSGPAASVAGALMHLRVSDGLYFEVGGTSTNIGVIRNGRPTVTYARVGGHETYVSSIDVRVIGIAGGSLVRATRGRAIDVGPRSAHIAGLPYAAFADEGEIVDPRIELFEPFQGHLQGRLAEGCGIGAGQGGLVPGPMRVPERRLEQEIAHLVEDEEGLLFLTGEQPAGSHMQQAAPAGCGQPL